MRHVLPGRSDRSCWSAVSVCARCVEACATRKPSGAAAGRSSSSSAPAESEPAADAKTDQAAPGVAAHRAPPPLRSIASSFLLSVDLTPRRRAAQPDASPSLMGSFSGTRWRPVAHPARCDRATVGRQHRGLMAHNDLPPELRNACGRRPSWREEGERRAPQVRQPAERWPAQSRLGQKPRRRGGGPPRPSAASVTGKPQRAPPHRVCAGQAAARAQC